ncbi:hypothetical protein V6N13_018085 [Hibiscus sabdariffa]
MKVYRRGWWPRDEKKMKVGVCKTKQRDWSILSFLRILMGSLYWSHRICMQGVCKGRRKVSLDGIPMDVNRYKRVIGRSSALGLFDIHGREWKLIVKRWPALHHDSNFFGELVAFPRCPYLPHRPKRVIKASSSSSICLFVSIKAKIPDGINIDRASCRAPQLLELG